MFTSPRKRHRLLERTTLTMNTRTSSPSDDQTCLLIRVANTDCPSQTLVRTLHAPTILPNSENPWTPVRYSYIVFQKFVCKLKVCFSSVHPKMRDSRLAKNSIVIYKTKAGQAGQAGQGEQTKRLLIAAQIVSYIRDAAQEAAT
jgi:hypothetical protein